MNQTSVTTCQTNANSWTPLKPLPCKERSLNEYTWVFECRLQKSIQEKRISVESGVLQPTGNKGEGDDAAAAIPESGTWER
jgi:hypothetical protein